MNGTEQFAAARDLLLTLRNDYARARAQFAWPRSARFNWAVDWFDHLAAVAPDRPALVLARASGEAEAISFAELAAKSDHVATTWYRAGVRRGEVMLLVCDNVPALWECALASMKLGVIMIPASPRLTRADLADRCSRGAVRYLASDASTATRLAEVAESVTKFAICGATEAPPAGWRYVSRASDAAHEPRFGDAERGFPVADTALADPLLGYFTSGTTSLPKLVMHTHGYPIGHLSTMYWVGLQPGDVHLNVAAPGWAKHLGSGLYAAWNAEATVVVDPQERFSARATLEVMEAVGVTTMCAPPTAWRMLAREDVAGRPLQLREAVSAGEPLEPAVITHLERALGVTVRNGYGQTETSHLIGHTPGQPIKRGSMGRPMPGFDVQVGGQSGATAEPGELKVLVPAGGIGVMAGYGDADGCTVGASSRHCADDSCDRADAPRHRTGDLVTCDEDGYLTFIGRVDDVFKSSGYRVSPLEIEQTLLEHPAVAEVAVIPSPDPLRAWVPKAYVSLATGWKPDRDTAGSILLHGRANLSPYKQIRRLTFCELPKTISGKVRRGELRQWERDRRGDHAVSSPGTMREWHDHEFVSA